MLDGDVKELPPVAHVFSREAELGRLRNFVSAGGSARCLSLVGAPGVGKTTLWEAGLDLARSAGATVLWTRASEAETSLSFAALRDLADGVDPGVLAELPTPQRRAIEIAVRLVEPIDLPPDSLAISAGFLGVLRRLAVRRPTVVAIDDVQWLDAASLEVLMFVARRQPSESVRFLFSRRSDTASELERALGPAGLEHVPVAGLSLGAIGRLLGERLNLVPPRRILRRLHQMTQGNPLFALELGRLLAERGIPEVGDELPFPNLYTDIFGERVLALPAPMRRALLAVALCAKLPRTDLEELVDALVVEDAIAAGLLLVERAEIRPSHPLLAAAARHHSTARQRRDLHRDLAEAVGDPILRARHMAVATSRPDPAIAAEVAKAAEIAAERGATEDAEDLAQHGVRLTPPDAPEWPHRLLTLARYHLAVGDSHAVETLLTTHMDGLPAGRVRAQAHILRGWAMDTAREFTELGLALAEAAEDPEVRADVRSRQAVLLAISNVEHLDEAERLAGRRWTPLASAEPRSSVGSSLPSRGRSFCEGGIWRSSAHPGRRHLEVA